MTSKSPHDIDIYVGKQVRYRRWQLNMTQTQLATAVGIKFQQIQKYETGANRISASRLWEISNALGVPITYFFDRAAVEEQSRSFADSSMQEKLELLSDPTNIWLLTLLSQMDNDKKNYFLRTIQVASDYEISTKKSIE